GWNGDGAIVYHEPAERSSPGENAPHEIPHTVEDDRNSARPARTAESPSRPCQEPALGVACPHTLAVRAPGPVPLGGDTPQSDLGWNGDGAIVYHEPAERSSPGENAPHEIPHTVEDDRNSARPARTAESPSRPCQEPALGVACPHTLAVRAPGPVPLGGDTPQ